MGCVSSKIDGDEALQQKARKEDIKKAVALRVKFATSYANYITSLKNTGAVLIQFSELVSSQEITVNETPRPSTVSLPRPSVLDMPPPPPEPQEVDETDRVTDFSGDETGESDEEDDDDEFEGVKARLSRAASMPIATSEINEIVAQQKQQQQQQSAAAQSFPEQDQSLSKRLTNPPKPHDILKPVPPEIGTVDGKMGSKTAQAKTLNFSIIIKKIDDLFIQCCHAGSAVSRLLEAQRAYNHTPMRNERNGIDEHCQRVSRILTWKKESYARNPTEEKNRSETFASTLDSIYAWEKKLYNEVRTAEATKLDLKRKQQQLMSDKERGQANEKLEALVHNSEAKLHVEIVTVHAAFREVVRLRDDILTNMLVDLLKEIKDMWKIMNDCHLKQTQFAKEMMMLNLTPNTKETTETCKSITEELHNEIETWHTSLDDMIKCHKQCLEEIYHWQSKFETTENYVPSNKLGELCHKWMEVLQTLSPEDVIEQLRGFSNTLVEISGKQKDETDLKAEIEGLEDKLCKKKFQNVDLFRSQLQENKVKYTKMCEENIASILDTLKNGLPQVLSYVAKYSGDCRNKYEGLLTSINETG